MDVTLPNTSRNAVSSTLNKTDIIPAGEVVQMATKNGARMLGFEKVGDIVEGNFADIIISHS